jgi:hypothetical protein
MTACLHRHREGRMNALRPQAGRVSIERVELSKLLGVLIPHNVKFVIFSELSHAP